MSGGHFAENASAAWLRAIGSPSTPASVRTGPADRTARDDELDDLRRRVAAIEQRMRCPGAPWAGGTSEETEVGIDLELPQ